MDDKMHSHISDVALGLLNGKAKEFWLAEKEIFCFASNYPDYFAGGGIPAPEMLVKEPDWTDYNLVPFQGEKVPCHNLIKPLEIRNCYPAVIEFAVDGAVSAIRSGNAARAAKFAGVLSHLAGDSGQVAHVMDERVTKLLFPQKTSCYMIHGFIEKQAGQIPPHEYVPRLLGNSLKEFKWRLLEELQKLKQGEIAELVPVMQALLARDKEAASVSAGRTAGHCADLVSDILLTLFEIAEHSADMDSPVSLCDLEEVECYSDMLFNFGVMIDRMPQNKWTNSEWDNPLPFDLGKGIVRGIGLLPLMAPGVPCVRDAYVDYSLPSGVFHFFETELGLNRLAENETGVIFRIILDGELVYESPAVTTENSPLTVKVELGNASMIRLYVRDMREPPCSTKFMYPVFGNPNLVRKS